MTMILPPYHAITDARVEFLFEVCIGGGVAVFDCLLRLSDGQRYRTRVVQPADRPPDILFLARHLRAFPQDFAPLP